MKSASSREPPARYPCFHCVGALNGDYAGRISPFEHRLSLFVVGYWNRETSIRPSFLEGSLKCASSSPCRNIVSTAHLILGFDPYLILRTLPPLLRVQMLKMSSPFRTLSTAPQTSSLASANWSPTIAMRRSSQYLSATPFFNLTIHLPPLLFSSSSQTGRMPFLNMW